MAITDDLAGYWNLSEASGTRNDSTANANHLTDNNTVTGTTGPGGHAASLFTRANVEYLSHAANAVLLAGDFDFTIASWANLSSYSSAQGIFSYGWAGGDYSFALQEGTQNVEFGVSPDGNAITTVVAPGTLSLSTWYFIIAWHDSVNNQIGIAVNAGTATTTTHTGGVINMPTYPFVIGSRDLNTSPFGGALSLAGFWKRVLTTDERTFLYNGGNGRNFAELTPTAAESHTMGIRVFNTVP